jgi:ABC-type enterochelin transport system permease subunit
MALVAYVHQFLNSLVFTVSVETIVLWVLMRFVMRDTRTPLSGIIFSGIFASFSTISYVWFVFPVVATWPKGMSTLYSEPFAVLVEALVYHITLKLRARDALAVSFICNVVSFLVGPLLRSAGLWLYW